MNSAIEVLKQKIIEIKDEVDKVYIDPTGRSEPIYDGVVDPEKYLSSKYRILWILKEPGDEDDGTGGGWSVASDNLGVVNVFEKVKGSRTYEPMTYVTYSILNGFPKWDEMDFIRDDPEMAKVLQSIAYINVKKLPGFHSANNEEIAEWYQKAKTLLWKQVEAFSPDIIIGCRPHMPCIMEEAGVVPTTIDSIQYGAADSRLYVFAHHPAQRGNRGNYVNSLINVIQSQKELIRITTPRPPTPMEWQRDSLQT